MNAITRYRPNYCEGFPQEKEEFESLDELLKISWVKQWMEVRGFSLFVMSRDALIAVFDNYKEWWTIGFVEKPEEIKLPQFNKPTV